MTQLIESLKAMVSALAISGVDKNSFKLVVDHGFQFQGLPLPADIKRGTQKECFKNSLELAIELGYTYVEGYAFRTIPIHHAWCIDDRGNVIDPTIANPQDCEYYGIPLDFDFVMGVAIDSGYYGILDNHKFRKIYDIDPTEYIHPEWQKY